MINIFRKKDDNLYTKIYRDGVFLGNFKILKRNETNIVVSRMTQNGVETSEILTINPDYFEIREMEKTESCGILFVYKGMFLLVEQGSGDYSFPKGKIEAGEDVKDAAIRELYEETNISFPKKLLPNKYYTIKWFKEKKFKIYNYFIYKLNDNEFETLFNGEYVLPKENLQEIEITWAGFVTYDDLQRKLSQRFFGILKHF
jgi:ADP-ribose pyrophosphatase YjhB (NUDIX family)